MAGYLSKPGFLIKGLESSLRSPVRHEQLRKAAQLPGFKPQPAAALPRAAPRAATGASKRSGSKK